MSTLPTLENHTQITLRHLLTLASNFPANAFFTEKFRWACNGAELPPALMSTASQLIEYFVKYTTLLRRQSLALNAKQLRLLRISLRQLFHQIVAGKHHNWKMADRKVLKSKSSRTWDLVSLGLLWDTMCLFTLSSS